jgi:hypothetical protein
MSQDEMCTAIYQRVPRNAGGLSTTECYHGNVVLSIREYLFINQLPKFQSKILAIFVTIVSYNSVPFSRHPYTFMTSWFRHGDMGAAVLDIVTRSGLYKHFTKC